MKLEYLLNFGEALTKDGITRIVRSEFPVPRRGSVRTTKQSEQGSVRERAIRALEDGKVTRAHPVTAVVLPKAKAGGENGACVETPFMGPTWLADRFEQCEIEMLVSCDETAADLIGSGVEWHFRAL
jgi:hypothetical protein